MGKRKATRRNAEESPEATPWTNAILAHLERVGFSLILINDTLTKLVKVLDDDAMLAANLPGHIPLHNVRAGAQGTLMPAKESAEETPDAQPLERP